MEECEVRIKSNRVTRIDDSGMRKFAPEGVYVVRAVDGGYEFSNEELSECFILVSNEWAQYAGENAFKLLGGNDWPVG